jgi:hypothetical protein
MYTEDKQNIKVDVSCSCIAAKAITRSSLRKLIALCYDMNGKHEHTECCGSVAQRGLSSAATL